MIRCFRYKHSRVTRSHNRDVVRVKSCRLVRMIVTTKKIIEIQESREVPGVRLSHGSICC